MIRNLAPLEILITSKYYSAFDSITTQTVMQAIRINAIAPGGVKTDMEKRVVESNRQLSEAFDSMHTIGRIADPKEIADAVVWFYYLTKLPSSWVIHYELM